MTREQQLCEVAIEAAEVLLEVAQYLCRDQADLAAEAALRLTQAAGRGEVSKARPLQKSLVGTVQS